MHLKPVSLGFFRENFASGQMTGSKSSNQGTEIEIVVVVESQVASDIIRFTMRRTAFLFVGNTIGLLSTMPEVVSLPLVGGNKARVPVLPADNVVKYSTTRWSLAVPPLHVTALPSISLLCCVSEQMRLFFGVVQVPPAVVFMSFDTSIIIQRYVPEGILPFPNVGEVSMSD
ncbi:MAG: hypothetical protein U1F27_07060 [Turneriella sp.]